MSTATESKLSVWQSDPVRAMLGATLLASVSIILVALAFEYIGGYRPCPLCLRQRYAYYFAIPASAAGLLALRTGSGAPLARVLLGLIAVGYLINTYFGIEHSGVEWKWWAGPETCAGALPSLSGGGALDLGKPVIRCDDAPWRFLGLSFAGWNAVLSLGLFGLAAMGFRAAALRPAQAGR